jgi:hypothetical protein
VFTSGIVSILPAYRIALFFTGRRHAGENLEAVLRQRASELGLQLEKACRLLPSARQKIWAHPKK